MPCGYQLNEWGTARLQNRVRSVNNQLIAVIRSFETSLSETDGPSADERI